jgi:hypothetical protein
VPSNLFDDSHPCLDLVSRSRCFSIASLRRLRVTMCTILRYVKSSSGQN